MGNLRKKGVCALCDCDTAYMGRLMDYLDMRQGLPFEVQAFSSPEPLKAYAKEHSVDLVLIAEELMSEEIMQLGTERILLLTEEETELPGFPAVCKYQSSDTLLQEILCCYRKAQRDHEDMSWPVRRLSVYGVFSPVGRCGKTGFALILGQVLAESGRVLYLNFEEYAGFDSLLPKQDADLSELLLYLLQGMPGVFRKLQELVRPLGQMDYIPPGVRHADYGALEWEHWELFLNSIRMEGVYDAVILDLGAPTDALFQILECCDAVYMPVKKDPASEAKLREFYWVCDSSGYGRCRERIREICPPKEDVWPFLSGKNPRESELYRYVKEVLQEPENTMNRKAGQEWRQTS